MKLNDFVSILKQCTGKTFQFALGGCGDPDQHENFAEILALCNEYKIVPNFTTSGFGLTQELAALCKTYCGAVAVSWYRSHYTIKAIDMLFQAKVKTNIHYVLNRNTIDEALLRLQENSFPQSINAIIFLLHKPVGQGTKANVLSLKDEKFKTFLRYATTHDFNFRIGFDSCTVPALIQDPVNIDLNSVDTCEGARFSAYITPDLKLLPCSFDNHRQKWAVDLHQYSLKEAWDSQVFEDFRNHFRKACPDCQKRDYCLGGCPICEEIVLCSSKFKKVKW